MSGFTWADYIWTKHTPDKVKRRCYARGEYRSVQALVENKLANGHSIRMIYDVLRKDGCLTMAYATFCDYVRGGGVRAHGKKTEAPILDASDLIHEILESIELRTEYGFNLKSVYQKLTEFGIIGFSYSDFCDYLREAGAYQGRDIPDDFVFFKEDGLIALYYRLESLFPGESDKAEPENFQ